MKAGRIHLERKATYGVTNNLSPQVNRVVLATVHTEG